MLSLVPGYALAAIALWAAVEAALTSHQAYSFLIEEFRYAASAGLALVSCALLIAATLALANRGPYRVLALAATIAGAVFVVLGLSGMGGLALTDALKQATCLGVVPICYNQVAAFMTSLPWLVLAIGATVLPPYMRRATRGA